MALVARKPDFVKCEQQVRRSACASIQSDQRIDFHHLESIIAKPATCIVSIFLLISVAEQAGLSLTWSERP